MSSPRLRRSAGLLAIELCVAACGTQQLRPVTDAPSTETVRSPVALPSANSETAGGCARTTAYRGPAPDSPPTLGANSWANATPSSAGIRAYFWSEPPFLLASSRSQSPHGNKVRWIVQYAPAGQLAIAATSTQDPGETKTFAFSAAESPADNFPSSIDLPTPGCWHLAISVGSVVASMDLEVG
jgi:hypothetical protein